MDVEQVEQRALGAWSAASTTAGAGFWLLGHWGSQPVLRAFGAQSFLWGAGTGALVISGGATFGAGQPSTQVQYARLVNVVADLGAIAGGVVLAARPHSAPRWLRWPDRTGRHLRGHGLAVVVQGVALLMIDAAAARRLHAVDAREFARSRDPWTQSPSATDEAAVPGLPPL